MGGIVSDRLRDQVLETDVSHLLSTVDNLPVSNRYRCHTYLV